MIGTCNGVIKCRSMGRMVAIERWNQEVVLGRKGTIWEPAPGSDSQHIPVDIDDTGVAKCEEDDCQPTEAIEDEAVDEGLFRFNYDKLHVSQKAIRKYGPTTGCPTCGVIVRRGPMSGRIGYNHSNTCRSRVIELMKEDPEYRNLINKQESQQEGQSIEVVTQAQVVETRGHARKAIHAIQQRMTRDRYSVANKLDLTMMEMLINEIGVAEVYSPARITSIARRMGLQAGWSLDITTCDSDGRAWGFNDAEMRNRAARKILSDEPLLLIGSPTCIAFSVMNRVSYARMSQEEVNHRMEYGRKHLRSGAKLYAIQWRAGRYFLHEHPEGASSWEEQCIKSLLAKEDVIRVDADQCMYGLKSYDGERGGPARKGIGFMTNSVCIANKPRRRCPNRTGQQVHNHVALENGRTRAAQIYPDGLCKVIGKGLQEQTEMDTNGQFLLMNIDAEAEESSQDLRRSADRLKRKYQIVEEENDEQMETAWDDVSGAELNPSMVKDARKEEMDYVRKMHWYDKVPIAECKRATGKMPITVRWIDINKGDQEHPNYRSRIVAREINTCKRDDLFAATPPLEGMNVILYMTATANNGEVVMINDISRAFFRAKVERDVYIQLPEEARNKGEEHLCGKLRLSMYGARDAVQNWYKECSQQLVRMRFRQGVASPCTFYHHERQLRIYVHGDNYVSTGTTENLQWMRAELEKRYQVKTQVLGPGEGQLKQVNILYRIVSWDGSRGIVYEADPRHAEIVIDQLELQDAKDISTPGTREEGHTIDDHEDKLSERDSTKYRAIVARLNHLIPDRPDIPYAAKELARAMSNPSNGDWVRLMRLGRYIKRRPRLQQIFQWQHVQSVIITYRDADLAGRKQTRKSTTGGCVTIGKHTIQGGGGKLRHWWH